MPVKLNSHLAGLSAYVPGRQINEPDIIKINTNECPYPPSQTVLEAVAEAARSARKYPEPTCRRLREAIARDLDCEPEQILVGNGSDEILRLIFHAYAPAGSRVATLNPTYSLYPVLGQMFGATIEEHPAEADAPLPEGFVTSDAAAKFLPNPNPPYGIQYDREDVEAMIRGSNLVVLDEAYVDYADWSGVDWIRKHSNVLVTRTFSKSHALAGLRVGFAVGPLDLIRSLNVIRDSYNVNVVSQAAALAAWNDKAWLSSTVAKLTHLRDFLTKQLRDLGLQVANSRGNFVFARHPLGQEIAEHLASRRILVRHFNTECLEDGMRISIGTEDEMKQLLAEIRGWLASRGTMVHFAVPDEE